MAKKQDCSELAKTITELALHIGSQPGMGSIGKITAEMSKELPGITREMVADAIVEATTSQAHAIDEARQRIADVKREARSDVRLRKSIEAAEQHIARGTLPPGSRRKGPAPTIEIAALQAIRKDLNAQLRQSDAAVRQRLEKSIETLNQKLQAIEDGSYIAPVRRQEIDRGDSLDRLAFERDQIRRLIDRRIDAMKPLTVWSVVTEPFNIARAVMTSFDFSAVFRQGGFIVMQSSTSPQRAKQTARAMKAMFQSLSARKAHEIMGEIESRQNAPLYARYKLAISPIDSQSKLTKQEEAYMSRFSDRIPIVAATQRAYTVFLNHLRADVFDAAAQALGTRGDFTAVQGQAIANYINVATGRGPLGKAEIAAEGLNVAFFAPKLVASRFQLLLGQPLWRGDKATRKYIAGEYARYLIGVGILYSLTRLAFDDDEAAFEFDPRSSDFGKIRVGNTRIDPLSGLAQVTVLLARLTTGQMKSATTGEISALRGDERQYRSGDGSSVLGRFLRTKLSPMFGTVVDVIAGENVVGEPVTLASIPARLLIPLTLQELYESIQEHGAPKGAALSMLEVFGAGLQTWSPRVNTPSLAYDLTSPRPTRRAGESLAAFRERRDAHETKTARALELVNKLDIPRAELDDALKAAFESRGVNPRGDAARERRLRLRRLRPATQQPTEN